MNEIIGRYVQIDRYRIYYETIGEGQPIICLPTAGASTGEYRNVLPILADNGYQAIALDPPGHGNSYPDLMDLSVPKTKEEYVDFAWNFTQKLNLNRPVFVGCAMSGSAMLFMAIKYGDKLSAVVAAEGNSAFNIDPVQLNALNHPHINMADMMMSTTPGVCSKNINQEVLNECIWHNAKNAVPDVIHADLTIYDGFNVTEKLDTIVCPVLHLYGEEDYCTLDDEKKTIIQNIQKIKQVALPETGHLSSVENPRGFSTAIIEFLNDYKI